MNFADITWMLVCSALVLLMTPGLAFFYGGMVQKKNVISTMFQSYISMAFMTVIWFVVGFSLSFGESIGGIVGNPLTYPFMNNVTDSEPWSLAPTIPLLLFAFFQLKFAIITPALITGAFAERVKFKSYLIFIGLFTFFIYSPLAHMTWHPQGLLFKLGVLDFAGGTVVHMSAGIAALACAVVLKPRFEKITNPSRITYVLLGAGLLWFGWIGFNGGSALAANSTAVLASFNTTLASASAMMCWLIMDWTINKKPSAMGAAIGAVVGLVAITPAAGFVNVSQAFFIGIISSIISNIAVRLRSRSSLDDTLDVFPSHGIGGIVGMILTGLFASNGKFWTQTFSMIGVFVYVYLMTIILLKITNKISPMNVDEEDEKMGLDITQHEEKL